MAREGAPWFQTLHIVDCSPEHMTDKHIHHHTPKKYLRGFTLSGEKSLIWEFAREGPAFDPGPKRGRNNPALTSVEKYAGAELDGYACPNPDGTMDYNSYEDTLARIEHRSDRIFDKLRNHEMITPQEKEEFTNYVALTLRRGPARRIVTKELWPKVVEEVERNQLQDLLLGFDALIAEADLNDAERLGRLRARRDSVVEQIESYKNNGMPRKMELDTLVGSEMKRVRRAIGSMNWQFFEAPKDKYFLTSDNPVHFFKGGIGLRMPYSELVFPISSRLALVGSYRNVREGFVPANGQAVNEINRRVVSQAAMYAYGCSSSSWVLKLLRKTCPRFELLYPYDDASNQFPRRV